MSRVSASLAVTAVLLASSLRLPAESSLAKAEQLYQRTEYEASLALLDKHASDAATSFLIGRNYFMIGDFKKSTDYLQRATEANPKSGEYMDWLGRAYGKRAETSSNPFTAPALATKARQAFEKSVQLDPKNADALSDLFDYYLDAPGFLGGGYDKAEAVADKIAAIDPPEGFYERAKLAQKRKEFDSAEEHLREFVQATPGKIAGLLEYAKFLANQGRTKESDALLARAQRIKPDAPTILYTRADLLIRQKRNLSEAKDLLQKYLRSPITADDPPKQEAQRLLKQIRGA